MFKTNVAKGFCVVAIVCLFRMVPLGRLRKFSRFEVQCCSVDSTSHRTFFPHKVLVPSLMIFSLQEA